MVIDNKFQIGQEVFLKTDIEQKKRIVSAIIVRTGNCVYYEVCCGTESKWHYDFEMSLEKDVVLSTTN